MATTIAFSTKTLDWKTRYSFEPNLYMTSGDEMVSFPIGNSLSAWQHDTGTHSVFYGENYKPFVSVVSNEDPSATKVYEAMSIEGDKAPSSVVFTTRTAEDQSSSLGNTAFKKMEGKFYSDIPKNAGNLDAALGYIGNTTVGDLRKIAAETSNRLYLESRPIRIPNGSLVIYPLAGENAIAFINSVFSETFNAASLQVFLDSYEGGRPIAITFELSGYLDDVITDVASSVYVDNSLIYVSKDYDPYTNSLLVNEYLPVERIEEALDIAGVTDVVPDSLVIPLFTYNNPSISGEDMRGDFIKVDMEFPVGSYFEVYAVNIDQHKTKLDHSLGQNN